MVVITPLADSTSRWAGVPPTKKKSGGAARVPQPVNPQNQSMDFMSTAAWGNKLMLPSSNAWGSLRLLHPKNDGASGSPSHIDDRPSSRGSSTSSSTVGSDFRDVPLYHVPTVTNRPRSTETRSGSLQHSCFPDSFTNVLKAPSRTIAKRAPTSHGKGFSLSIDDFPVLGSKNSASNSQQVTGHSSEGRPTIGSGIVVSQDGQRKRPMAGTGEVISSSNYEHESTLRTDYVCEGGDPIPAAKLTSKAQKTQPHGPQAPNLCMPPPWLDYWHPPPDHPPDENRMLHRAEAPYDPYKHADPSGSSLVESFAHSGQFTLNQDAALRPYAREDGCCLDIRGLSHPQVPADHRLTDQRPHVLGKVKDDLSDAIDIEKQPIIKKDVALLEKIKCLNNKARNFHALKLSNLLSSMESKVEHEKNICAELDHVTKDILLSAATSEIGPDFDRGNSVSESNNPMPINPPNVPTDGVSVVGLSEQKATEFCEAGKLGKSADYLAYGRGTTSRNWLDGCAKDMPCSISRHGWEGQSMVDALRAIVIRDAQQNQPFSRNTSQQALVTAADKVQNLLDYDGQDANDWISKQKVNAIARLEELNRHQLLQSQKSNDALLEADNNLYHEQKTGRDGAEDTCCIVSADGPNVPWPANGVDYATVSSSSTPASNTEGVSKGPWIHNVMSSAKNTEVNMMACKSTSQSHDNSALKHWQMEDRQRQFYSREPNIRERSNIAETSDYVSNTAETPADTLATEAKPQEKLSTRNKNIKRDSAAVRPASPPVFGSEKNTIEVSRMHQTLVPYVAISSSMVPAQVISAKGIMVGGIMLDDVPLASVNQELAAAAKEVHNKANSLSKPQQIKKSGKDHCSVPPVESPVWNDSVLHTPIKQTGNREKHEEGGPNSMPVSAVPQPSGNHSTIREKMATMQRSETGWYAHKPVYEELQRKNLGQTLPAENHKTSYDNRANANLETTSHDKEAHVNLTSAKADVPTELKNWLDKKMGWGQGRHRASLQQKSTEGLASVVQNLAEPACYFNVADVVQELSDQCRAEEQFESKTHDATEDRSKLTETVVLPSSTWETFPVNNWEGHRATDSPRHYHVEGQRNAGSSYGYKERAGRGRFIRGTSDLSISRWMPKHIFHPQSNAQDDDISEWLQDSHHSLSDTNNSHGMDRKLTRIVDRDGGMDLQGGQGNDLGMSFKDENPLIWNETEWEYQQLFPAPHHFGQQHSRSDWDANEDRQKGRGRHSENYDAEEVGCPDGWDRKPTQIVDGDSGMDLPSGKGNGDMSFEEENLVVLNETEWEYQQLLPAPHHLGQQHRGRDHNANEDRQRGSGGHSEYFDPKPVGSPVAACNIQRNTGGAIDDPVDSCETPAASRARWMPKYISHPQTYAQDNGISEWPRNSHHGLPDKHNSHGMDSKSTRVVDRKGAMDLSGGQGNVGMTFVDENLAVWNEKEWEYQQPFPAPHCLGQQHGGRGRSANDGRQRGRGRHSDTLEYHSSGPVRSPDAAPDVQWNTGGAVDHSNRGHRASSRAGSGHVERRHYI
ncbi:hypothetical protein BRADI_4g09850v3 [Brachypodium distachyon]|uniref:Uncharacterized protein n=1 Tax=Brachypodium distachyon TaxID=15368 RepID=A0A2K2CLP5_BRADI|nr:hypothetical protein BRADI_4g09850v3 [Brachypodium distachyon]